MNLVKSRGYGFCLCGLVALVVLTTGCIEKIAVRTANKLATDEALKDAVRLPLNEDREGFVNCFKKPGGGCPDEGSSDLPTLLPTESALELRQSLRKEMEFRAKDSLLRHSVISALDVLDDPTYKGILDTYTQLARYGLGPTKTPRETPTLNLGWRETSELLGAITTATELGGWENFAWKLEEHAIAKATDGGRKLLPAWRTKTELYEKLGDRLGPGVAIELVTTGYIATYLQAYFRGGHFVEATLDLTNAKKQWEEALKKQIGGSDAEVAAIVDDLIKEYLGDFNPKFTFGSVQGGGFVTRGGVEYKFPVIEIKVDPTADEALTITKLDPLIVGNDLLRVILEATFDGRAQLPGVSRSTAVVKLGHAVNEASNAGSPESRFLDEKDFASVEKWANRGEALATVLTGRLVRGGGWAALNNESLAGMVETIVGVFVRKWTEKVAWCAYSCTDRQVRPDEVKRTGLSPVAEGRTVPLEIVIEGRMVGLGPPKD